MFKSNVKITYAESWLPIHHKFFIHTVELLSARIALEKRSFPIGKLHFFLQKLYVPIHKSVFFLSCFTGCKLIQFNFHLPKARGRGR